MAKPAVIFLDAVGTLFGVQGTVGEIYSRLAQQAGVNVDAQHLNTAFIDSFLAAPKAAFPGVEPQELPNYEFQWWQAVARRAFEEVGVLANFRNFEQFFHILFDYFATPEPWFVYPDVPQALTKWQQQGISLGVISNFDSRLHTVLRVLGLKDYFSSVTISTEIGAAKPNTQVFAAAVAKHQIPQNMVWHIGDSWRDDYEGAEQAGLTGIWLNRKGDQGNISQAVNKQHRASLTSNTREIANLLELMPVC